MADRFSSSALSPERWQKLDRIFSEALDRAPEDRAVFLDQACAGDANLRLEVEALLAQDADAGDFIETPAAAGVDTLLDITATLPEAPPEESMSGQRLGSFLLEDEIGRGGMGSVYRAQRDDGTYSQQVAIKVVKWGFAGPEVVERFRRERQILALVNHPNIAQIFDGGSTADGRPYLVMELIDGETLIKYSTTHNLGLTQRLRLFLDVCAAVAHAHQNLIIHRDLKPANIMVDHAGRVKLLDFGIAKVFHPDLPDHAQTRAASNAFLTPEYASPEQIRMERITTATDIYALGLILFEILTGQKAQRVPSSSMLEIERMVCQTEPRKPSEVRLEGVQHTANKLRGDLDNIVLKALRKEPERRYSTVNQLAEDIERHLDGLPVSARADSFLYRSSKFLRRNLLGTIGAAVVLASLIGGIAVATWQARIARGHFDSVRELAKSLLTEINPALSNVPGATKARHLIVKRSLEYLDKLSQSAGNNVELLTELASAYETIGNLQGNRNKENLGDYEGALKSFSKALELYQKVQSLAPAPVNRVWMVFIRAEAARIYPNSDEALRLAKEALEGAQALDHDYPGKYPNAVANAYFGLGYVYGQREEIEPAIDAFTKSRELMVAAHRTKNNLAVNDRYIGNLYRQLRNLDKAEFHARRALQLDEERVREEPSPRASMDLSYDFESLARTLRLRGNLPGALEMARRCDDIREGLAHADPHDNRTRTSKADVEETLGSIYADMGKKQEALSYLARALKTREELVKATPESPEDEYDLSGAYESAAEAYNRLGFCERAGEMKVKARAIMEKQHRKLALSRLDAIHICGSM
jgi:serine/threonine protein kinase